MQSAMSVGLDDDDDDEVTGGMYENGHWIWDDKSNELIFKSDLPEAKVETTIATAVLGSVEFKEDIDLSEQQRFRKRIQRKYTEGNDVVTLQDIKDVVLFTAPYKIVNPLMINLLHLPATERLLRALIFFCQYHLQVSDVMNNRTLELATKIRTPKSDSKEARFLENLEDLRLLVAKEYSNMIRGCGEFARYHHMGPLKKSQSLYRRESIMFESFIHFSIQIIWIALGRKSFSQIELEVNRIFKSSIFNTAQRKIIKQCQERLNATPNEQYVLLGHCLRKKHKVNMLSPLMNEVFCNRNVDHRMYGLGIVKYPHLSRRLEYMECALSLPENMLYLKNISVGILGADRNRFDILLREVTVTMASSSNVSVTKPTTKIPSKGGSSKGSGAHRKSIIAGQMPLFKDIVLPPKEHGGEPLGEFPTKSYPCPPCDEVQRKKWMLRFLRIAAKQRKTRETEPKPP